MALRSGLAFAFATLLAALAGCPEPQDQGSEIDPVWIPAVEHEYVVLAWNDQGIQGLNPTYDELVLQPPYSTLWAQVIRRGAAPEIVTSGITVEYRVVDNTSSAGKTDALGGDFAQFWDQAPALFGVELPVDTGLNLSDPEVHNGLSGEMAAAGDHFEAVGVPLTPVDDAGTWNPYQVWEVTVRDGDGAALASVTTTAPTSDEIGCARCHGQGGIATRDLGGGDPSPLINILALHDDKNGTNHLANMPILCASCHGSPVLGTTGPGSAETYLSAAIHDRHARADGQATCYDCHPGQQTRFSRSRSHAADDGNCVECHGLLGQLAGPIQEGQHVPWRDEPGCGDCHDHEGVAQVDTQDTLYRNARGHQGIYCAACHGSPHAMVPSREASDNAVMVQWQAAALPIGSCGACHSTSHGGGLSEFGGKHGGSDGRTSACMVCHTQVNAEADEAPHRFEWNVH